MSDHTIKSETIDFLKHIKKDVQFIIPVFQRNYCWEIEQCARLWDDIEKSKEKGHFLGIFVNVHIDTSVGGFQEWLVIDGQQRMTTLTLLMVALRNYLNENECSGTLTPEEIEKTFLTNESQIDNDRRFKLLLRGVDDETIRKYIKLKDKHELDDELRKNHSESIRIAYEYFRQKLADTALDPSDVWEKVSKLLFVVIKLDRTDEPQFVFETLNSTGVDLSQSDLVRNFLLMGLEASDQTKFYNEYWCKIENLFLETRKYLDHFLRDYVVFKERLTKPIKSDEIYDKFKEYKNIHELESEDILKDLVRYAPHYAKCVFPWSNLFTNVYKEIHNLRIYGTTHAILMMKLGDMQKSEKLGIDIYLKMLSLIDSYLMRRGVNRLTNKSYRTIFAGITHSIREDAPHDTFQVALYQLSGNYKFPTDGEFRTALEEGDLFHLRLCKPILDRLENHGFEKEPSPTGTYQIEHIMPQNPKLNDNWQEMLGDDWKKIHEIWVHRLGNLTLTGYNQTLSDLSFEEKKTIEKGFKDSAARLNKFVREQEKWTDEEIESRGKELTSRAIDIWSPLKVDAHVIEKVLTLELRREEAQSSPQEIEMEPDVRKLFNNVHSRISEFGDVITITKKRKSVCLHNPNLFVEIIPRKYNISILMPPEVNQIEDPIGIVKDANLRKSIKFATKHRDCNSYADIWTNWTSEQICAAVQIIKQAFEIANK